MENKVTEAKKTVQKRMEPKLKLINMDKVEVEQIEWLLYPFIPYGKVTIIQGDPGEGKTTMVLQIIAKLTRGEAILPTVSLTDDKENAEVPVNVIYQTAEDGLGDTIKPRLLAAGADCSKVLVIDDTDQPLTMADIRLEEAIIQTKARMVVLDPIQGFLGAEVDMHRANEIRPLMKRIAVLAEKYHCAIILIGHMNKNSNGKSSYRGLGSIDFQAAARSVLIVGRIKEEPETRVVCHTKSSLAPEGKSIAFRLDKDNGFEWIGEKDIMSLVRCAWAGSQKYGVLTWSGDVYSSFRSMREQLQAGLNMCVAGIPWWTSDIGGFLGGDIKDPAFKELLVRWFAWGAFCPVFRMHGERSPWYEREQEFIDGVRQLTSGQDNEVWSFGEDNYEILKKYLFIRERLRLYIRSCMEQASKTGAPVMRPLFFDFAEDKESWNVEDAYMFGPDLLVAPVMEAGATERRVYLPAGTKWTDAYTKKVYEGGNYVTVPAPIDVIPVFMREGISYPIYE